VTIEPKQASVAIVGAGDYIGGAIAKRFARAGYLVQAGRRNGDKLQPLVDEIEAEGGRIAARGLDARIPEAEAAAPLELVVFNIGANVNFPILETTDRVFRKVWEMACFSGFVTGREAARIMLPRQRGKIFVTCATAKFGLRAVAQSMARELWPQKIHVAHLIIDAGVDTAFVRDLIAKREGPDALETLDPDRLMPPEAIADAYWDLFNQPRTAWTFEQEIRPYGETW